MPRLFLSANGKVTDINAHSGTPYFVWRGAQEAGINLEPLNMPSQHAFFIRRHLWLLKQFALARWPRGYSRSINFYEAMWRPHLPLLDGAEIINHFQVFPPSVLARAEKGRLSISFYIDMTHKEMFENYAIHYRGYDQSLIRSTVELERRGYNVARRIITFSHVPAEVLKSEYGVNGDKIRVVVPGANIDEGVLSGDERPTMPDRDGSFTIGYVGMDYMRKGLLPLADAVISLRRKGLPVKLLVIGPTPPSLQRLEGIEFVGRIDKGTDMRRFVGTLRRCHLGALPSLAEGAPISLLEFLRLGIPVIGTAVNGITDIVKDGVGILVPKGSSSRDLANAIAPLTSFGASYEQLRRAAWERRASASWKRAIPELACALSLDRQPLLLATGR